MWKMAFVLTCKCGAESEIHCREWPPKVLLCANCKHLLALVAYDPSTEKISYRWMT